MLDTNVVLDLWLFEDARAAALRRAIEVRQLEVLVTAPVLAELADVLGRPFTSGWPVPPAQVLASCRAHSRLVDAAAHSGPPAPRCTDGDDQKFIDLAWSWPARWLVSRDRAVLKLARRAMSRGLHIVTPERWAALNTVA